MDVTIFDINNGGTIREGKTGDIEFQIKNIGTDKIESATLFIQVFEGSNTIQFIGPGNNNKFDKLTWSGQLPPSTFIDQDKIFDQAYIGLDTTNLAPGQHTITLKVAASGITETNLNNNEKPLTVEVVSQ